MAIDKNITVGSLVAQNYKTADIFSQFGIDFCCGGNITLEYAAGKYGVELQQLLENLEKAIQGKDPESDLINRLPLSSLIDHIIEVHHTFVRENIQAIPQYLEKLAEVHGANHPELVEVNTLFNGAVAALSSHLKDEEEILFPYVKRLEEVERTGKKTAKLKPDSIENVIGTMNDEHDGEGERFRAIAKLTNNYTVPADGCNTYRVGLEKLKAFEADLHRHIHLENNILFPKALELEKKVVN